MSYNIDRDRDKLPAPGMKPRIFPQSIQLSKGQ